VRVYDPYKIEFKATREETTTSIVNPEVALDCAYSTRKLTGLFIKFLFSMGKTKREAVDALGHYATVYQNEIDEEGEHVRF
jgi:hypothetical protein